MRRFHNPEIVESGHLVMVNVTHQFEYYLGSGSDEGAIVEHNNRCHTFFVCLKVMAQKEFSIVVN